MNKYRSFGWSLGKARRLIPIFVAMLLSVPAYGSRVFTSGWEEGISAMNLVQPVGNINGAVVTSPVRSGVYAFKAERGAAGAAYHRFNLVASVTSGTYFTRIPMRIPSAPNSDLHAFRVGGPGADAWRLVIGTDRTTKLVCVSDSSEIAGPTLDVDTWYVFEVRHVISDTVGELELRVNGSSQGSLTSKDTLPTNIQFWYVGIGNSVASTTIYYDDFAVNSSGGSFQTTWPDTNGKIALAVPGSDVANAWEDETSGPSTFANVNDLPGTPDDATGYNLENTTLNSVDRFSLATLPAEIPSGATMIVFHALARVGAGTSSLARLSLRIWDEGGTPTTGSEIATFSTSWLPLRTDWDLTYDISSKTMADVQDFDLGYINTTDDATRERRVTALWGNVEWRPAAAGTKATFTGGFTISGAGTID